MIITHHPLLLRGASSSIKKVKGRIISALNRHEIARFAHTNGDVAQDGAAHSARRHWSSQRYRSTFTRGVVADGQAIGLGSDWPVKPPLREFASTVARVMPK